MANYRARLNRRRLLGLIGTAGALAVAAACGSNNNKNTTSATNTRTASTQAATAATTSSAGTTPSAGSASDIAKQINDLVGPGGKQAGQGLKFKMGAVLALSGSGSYYGDIMSKGINLAVKHIKAAGGPDIEVTYKDHKSGDAAAGAAAARELGIAKIPACLASYAADIGAMLPAIAQYKMLTLDGGGGTSAAFKGKPYFWGTRAVTPDDCFPGVFKYVSQKFPNVKRVSLIGWETGAELDKIVADDIQKAMAPYNLEFLGLETTAIGSTDFSTVLARVKDKNPDLIYLGEYGLDPGYLMKQYVTTGMNAIVIGSEYTPDAQKVAGDAYNKYNFAFDYFDVQNPPNPWSKLFVDEFRREYNQDPDFYAADYYENTFVIWELIRRVLAKGGNPNDGAQLEQALESDPSFKSVYGGDSNTVGTLALDPQSHSVSKRALGLFSVQNGKPTPLAFFDLNAQNFRIVGG